MAILSARPRSSQSEVQRLGVLRKIAGAGLHECHDALAAMFHGNRGADRIAI